MAVKLSLSVSDTNVCFAYLKRALAAQKHTHTHLCIPFMSLETLLEYLSLHYIRVFSLGVQVPGFHPVVYVSFSSNGCGHFLYLRASLIFHSVPLSVAFHALSLTTWTLLDVCQLLTHTPPCYMHMQTIPPE